MVAAVVFLLAIGVTLLAWYVTSLSQSNAASRSFEEQAMRVEQLIHDRMRGYEQVLRSGAALFAASVDISRQEWVQYVEGTSVQEIYPGVQGLHFAQRVPEADVARHESQMRRDGVADYAVRPAGVRPEYYPLIWPAPVTERNLRARGFDLFSEPVRREAMERARDTGMPAVSGKVVLTGDEATPVPGFLYLQPIYARGMPVATIDDRRRAIIGFVFCPFRVADLMQGVIGKERDVLDTEVYDGAAATEAGLMYDDDGVAHALDPAMHLAYSWERQVRHGGRTWTIHFDASPDYLRSIDSNAPRWLLFGGLLMSVLVTNLVWQLLTSEAAALAAALHDGLTGLHNRRFLEASLKREEERARRNNSTVAIVQFDLDHFKKLNDAYGHAAGDEVLRCVGEVLRAATRGEDIVCRYGGEEFTLILPGATVENALDRANAIARHIFGLRMKLAGESLPSVSVSGGVAVFPRDGRTLRETLRRADHALLRAKREGRSRILEAQPSDPVSTNN
jgi:diguanylate cyclase (GGDEF)-like protein